MCVVIACVRNRFLYILSYGNSPVLIVLDNALSPFRGGTRGRGGGGGGGPSLSIKGRLAPAVRSVFSVHSGRMRDGRRYSVRMASAAASVDGIKEEEKRMMLNIHACI